jgi:hypothetical protein
MSKMGRLVTLLFELKGDIIQTERRCKADPMAIHVVSGAVHEVVVVDTKKGAIISRVRLKPQTP